MNCPECGSKKVSTSQDGMICNKCGLVIKEGYYSGKIMLI